MCKLTVQVILFEKDCASFYTNLHELFCQFISWTNWVNSGKFMDNCWISCQVMADLKKVYDDLIIINLYQCRFSNQSSFLYTYSKEHVKINRLFILFMHWLILNSKLFSRYVTINNFSTPSVAILFKGWGMQKTMTVKDCIFIIVSSIMEFPLRWVQIC